MRAYCYDKRPENPLMASLIHASGSGYFPFCISEDAGLIGENTFYPIGLTLETAMRWYWKIQTWQLVWEYKEDGITIYSQSFSFASHAQYLQSSLSGQINIPTDFRELVCSAETSVGASPPAEASPLDFCGMILFDDDNGNSPRLVRAGGLYYPRLYAGALIQGNPAPNTIGDELYTDPATITIDGLSIPARILQAAPGTIVEGVFTISPKSFWQY